LYNHSHMWSLDTPWFDVAVVLGIFAVGNILFGHFEAHKPKWRRLLKVAAVLAVFLTLSATVGRKWAYGVLMVPLLGAAYVHLRWLPEHGVNGWTGEPRDRYLELVTKKSSKAAGPRA
jgi:predicted small integral membrane protein